MRECPGNGMFLDTANQTAFACLGTLQPVKMIVRFSTFGTVHETTRRLCPRFDRRSASWDLGCVPRRGVGAGLAAEAATAGL